MTLSREQCRGTLQSHNNSEEGSKAISSNFVLAANFKSIKFLSANQNAGILNCRLQRSDTIGWETKRASAELQ